MRGRLGALVSIVAVVSSLTGWPNPGTATAAAVAAPPVRTVTATGAGTTTYPAYSETVDRFGVQTTAETGGVLSITADSTDPAATLLVDGQPHPPGSVVPVTGLATGDEVNVQLTDTGGTLNQSFVYLPPGFPSMTTTSAGAGPSPGRVFLTLVPFFGGLRFEAVVDEYAVPVYVRETLNPADLKLQPNGHYTVARGETLDLTSTFKIVELDAGFEPIDEHVTTGLVKTDFHDSILLPAGGRILMSYEPNPDTGLVDSVVEEVDGQGDVVLTWSSEGIVDPAVDALTAPFGDYAHLNSIDIMQDGNLLLSFRHTSQVMKVDRATGAVIWRLGGKRSDFTFPDDPLGGPCAQHTARELANGDIQIFDNGSKVTTTTLNPMCPDPANPTGPRIERPSTRVTVYRVDETNLTADLVRAVPTGSFSEFAGSAQRLGANGATDNLLIGTSLSTTPGSPDVLEVDAAGNVVWSLDMTASDRLSYRAAKFPAPDARSPEVTAPADGATFIEGASVQAAYRCTDTGGANLDICTSTVAHGQSLDTTPGRHTFTVTATDRAGNTARRTVRYNVLPKYQPDVQARRAGGPWVGVDKHGRPRSQSVILSTNRAGIRTIRVRIVNDGARRDRFVVTAGSGFPGVTVRYLVDGQDVTSRLVAGSFRTPRLESGGHWKMAARLTLGRHARAGALTRIEATSVRDTSRTDGVVVKRRPRR